MASPLSVKSLATRPPYMTPIDAFSAAWSSYALRMLRPGSLEGLAEEGLELFRRRPPRVSEVNLVVLASWPVALVGYEAMDSRDVRAFVDIGPNVQNLGCSALPEGLESHAGEGGETFLHPTARFRMRGIWRTTSARSLMAIGLGHFWRGDQLFPKIPRAWLPRIAEEYAAGMSGPKLAKKYGVRSTRSIHLISRKDERQQSQQSPKTSAVLTRLGGSEEYIR